MNKAEEYSKKLEDIVCKIMTQQAEEQGDDIYCKMGLLNEFINNQFESRVNAISDENKRLKEVLNDFVFTCENSKLPMNPSMEQPLNKAKQLLKQ